MDQHLIYRAPERSRATRKVITRSRASLRGALVARLPAWQWARELHFESALEYRFLVLTLVRSDVHDIWDQPPAVHYTSRDGRPASHVFDFLVSLTSGERIAVAIKPQQRAVASDFITELELIGRRVPSSFANKIKLVTGAHLDRRAAKDAARHLMMNRTLLTEVTR